MNVTVRLDDSQLKQLAELIAAAIEKRRPEPKPKVASGTFTGERMTYEEAAVLVGVEPQTLRKWVSTGKYDFPRPVEIGALRYFIRREVDAWLDARVRRA